MKNEMVKITVDPTSLYFLNPIYKAYGEYYPLWDREFISGFRADVNKVFESDVIENIIVRKEGGKLIAVFFCNKGLMTSMKEISSFLRNELNKPLSGGVIKSNNHIHIWKEI